MHAPNGTIKSLLPNAEQTSRVFPGSGRRPGFHPRSFARSRPTRGTPPRLTPLGRSLTAAPGRALPARRCRCRRGGSVTWADERLRFRLSGGGVTGPGRPLKSAPIYISRRPPAPGGGAGETRLPFPSREERGERVLTCSPENAALPARRLPRWAPQSSHRSTNAPRNLGRAG